jgi:hypothetical protein
MHDYSLLARQIIEFGARVPSDGESDEEPPE